MQSTAPTARQLSYLRTLALRTASTFVAPATRRQASAEIDRLLALPIADRADEPDPGERYATEVRPDELTGYGSTASWRSQPPPRSSGRGRPPAHPALLARYRVTAGERALYATRSGPELTVVDRPLCGQGESYPVESLSGTHDPRELDALLADYLAQASALDLVPMAPGALSSMLGLEGRR